VKVFREHVAIRGSVSFVSLSHDSSHGFLGLKNGTIVPFFMDLGNSCVVVAKHVLDVHPLKVVTEIRHSHYRFDDTGCSVAILDDLGRVLVLTYAVIGFDVHNVELFRIGLEKGQRVETIEWTENDSILMCAMETGISFVQGYELDPYGFVPTDDAVILLRQHPQSYRLMLGLSHTHLYIFETKTMTIVRQVNLLSLSKAPSVLRGERCEMVDCSISEDGFNVVVTDTDGLFSYFGTGDDPCGQQLHQDGCIEQFLLRELGHHPGHEDRVADLRGEIYDHLEEPIERERRREQRIRREVEDRRMRDHMERQALEADFSSSDEESEDYADPTLPMTGGQDDDLEEEDDNEALAVDEDDEEGDEDLSRRKRKNQRVMKRKILSDSEDEDGEASTADVADLPQWLNFPTAKLQFFDYFELRPAPSDVVYYFMDGHKEWVAAHPQLNSRMLPWVLHPSLPSVLRATVVSVRYSDELEPFYILSTEEHGDKTFEVPYRLGAPLFSPFIVLSDLVECYVQNPPPIDTADHIMVSDLWETVFVKSRAVDLRWKAISVESETFPRQTVNWWDLRSARSVYHSPVFYVSEVAHFLMDQKACLRRQHSAPFNIMHVVQRFSNSLYRTSQQMLDEALLCRDMCSMYPEDEESVCKVLDQLCQILSTGVSLTAIDPPRTKVIRNVATKPSAGSPRKKRVAKSPNPREKRQPVEALQPLASSATLMDKLLANMRKSRQHRDTRLPVIENLVESYRDIERFISNVLQLERLPSRALLRVGPIILSFWDSIEEYLLPIDVSAYPTYSKLISSPISISEIRQQLRNFNGDLMALMSELARMVFNSWAFSDEHICTFLCDGLVALCTVLSAIVDDPYNVGNEAFWEERRAEMLSNKKRRSATSSQSLNALQALRARCGETVVAHRVDDNEHHHGDADYIQDASVSPDHDMNGLHLRRSTRRQGGYDEEEEVIEDRKRPLRGSGGRRPGVARKLVESDNEVVNEDELAFDETINHDDDDDDDDDDVVDEELPRGRRGRGRPRSGAAARVREQPVRRSTRFAGGSVVRSENEEVQDEEEEEQEDNDSMRRRRPAEDEDEDEFVMEDEEMVPTRATRSSRSQASAAARSSRSRTPVRRARVPDSPVHDRSRPIRHRRPTAKARAAVPPPEPQVYESPQRQTRSMHSRKRSLVDEQPTASPEQEVNVLATIDEDLWLGQVREFMGNVGSHPLLVAQTEDAASSHANRSPAFAGRRTRSKALVQTVDDLVVRLYNPTEPYSLEQVGADFERIVQTHGNAKIAVAKKAREKRTLAEEMEELILQWSELVHRIVEAYTARTSQASVHEEEGGRNRGKRRRR
jgi:hypothetical protein